MGEIKSADVNLSVSRHEMKGTQTCIHQNSVQHSKFEKTDLPTTELGTTS